MRIRFSWVLSAILTIGCRSEPERLAARQAERELADSISIRRIVELGPDDIKFECGFPSSSDKLERVFVVTADLCLGCRDIGWLIREYGRALSPGSSIQVLVPSKDAEMSCKYLAKEVPGAAVFSASESVFPKPSSSDDILFIQLDGGVAIRSAGARTGQELLERLKPSMQ